jgi:hypothetical protein
MAEVDVMVKLVMLIAVIASVALPTPVSADSIRIVDTGPSGPTATRTVDWNTEWVAAEFSTLTTWRITSVEGWIVPRGIPRLGGPLRMSILSDGGNIPSDPLFSTITNIPGVAPAGWFGQSGLNWVIQRGSFWLSFEPLAETSFGMSGTTRAPLAHEANALLASDCDFHLRACWPWTPDLDMDLGVRINAEAVAPTPEPASLLLLWTAITAFVASVRRRGSDS